MRHLRRLHWVEPHGRLVSLTIGIAVSLLVAVGYFLSRGGQSTTISIEARDKHFTAFVDGKRVLSGDFPDASESGGVAVSLSQPWNLPSLPSPRGLDSMQIVDLSSGTVEFQDNFAESPERSAWLLTPGSVTGESGVWRATRGVAPIQLPGSWSDFRLKMSFRNVEVIQVGIRASDPGSGVFFTLRPFRIHDSSVALRQGGTQVAFTTGAVVEVSAWQSLRSMVAMVLRPLPILILLLAAAIPALTVLSLLRAIRLPASLFRPSAQPKRETASRIVAVVTAVAVGGLALGTTLWLITGPGQRVPHVPDELIYIFQAKILAHGQVSAPPPPDDDAFRFSNPSPLAVQDGRWFTTVAPGHPVALALGQLLGHVWLIPPILGALSVMFLFGAGSTMYRPAVGFMSALLFAVSPFFLMTASNFMTHNTAAFYLTVSLFFLALSISSNRHQFSFAFTSAFFLGMVFDTRPLTGVSLIPGYGGLLLWQAVRSESRGLELRRFAAFLLGGLLAFALYLVYRYLSTGQFSLFDPGSGSSEVLGFSGRNSPAIGVANEQAQLATLLLVIHNWPQLLGIGLVFLPFILGTRNKWDWFLLTCALSMTSAYVLYLYDGIMHGPRYWYESTPLLMLLAVRGIQMAAVRLAGLTHNLLTRVNLSRTPPEGLAFCLIAVPVLLLAVHGSSQWLFGNGTWTAEFVPGSASGLKGFNGADARFARVVQDAHLENALVLVHECGAWQCYGSLFWLNSPFLDSDVVIAREVDGKPEQTARVFAAYPDRYVYQADYGTRTLRPYATVGDEQGVRVKRAREIELQVKAPDPNAAALAGNRDNQRIENLKLIAGLLQTYRATRGSYPEARNSQTLCYYAADSGCALREFGALPADPQPERYLYWSDGVRFVIIVRLESRAGDCPADVPQALKPSGNIACAFGQAPDSNSGN